VGQGGRLTWVADSLMNYVILNLDSRGFAPRLYKVVDIVNKVLSIYSSKLVSRY
jgi:hypothetical protein